MSPTRSTKALKARENKTQKPCPCHVQMFVGDLRNQFNLKDELTFKFKVVEEYASGNYSFETLDYFLESYGLIAEGTAANIEDYLVK